MVSKTFYILIAVAMVNVVIGIFLAGLDTGTAVVYRILPTWILALMLFIVAVLDVLIAYFFENYTVVRVKKK